MVCWCGGVTEEAVIKAVMAGNTTLEQLKQATGVCPDDNDCARNNPKGRCCAPDVMALVKRYAPGAAGSESCCSCCKQN